MEKTRPILVFLIAAMFTAACGSETPKPLRIDGSTGVKPLMEALAAGYQKKDSTQQFIFGEGLNPEKRIEALVNGDIDIAMASHGIDVPSLEARDLAVVEFARMAVVWGIHESAGVSALNIDQVCGIYSGTITNWKEIGGNDVSIVRFARPATEVDSEEMLAHIACLKPEMLEQANELFPKSGAMARAITSTPGSIGMTTMVRVAQSEGKMVAASLNSIEPATDNVRRGLYPMVRSSFLVVRTDFPPSVKTLVRFIRSHKGAQIIEANSAAPTVLAQE